jgi:hypothetical protein
VRGKRGQKRCFGASDAGVSVKNIAGPHLNLAEFGDFTAVFIERERSSPGRFAKISFGSGCFELAGRGQVDSRTRIRPSSSWTSGARHVGL